MPSFAETEVDESVVDDIDASPVEDQRVARQREPLRAGNRDIQAARGEQALRQAEFRIERLSLRIVVDDRDPSRLADTALAAPLAFEHLDDRGLETLQLSHRVKRLLDLRATGPLCPSQLGV